MKLEVTEPNYCATIIRIHVLNKLQGLDRLLGVPVFGFQALTSSAEVGQLMVLFTAETQLSEEFASVNNLFRHSNLNLDPLKVGYLEDNGRIKAVRFKGNPSNALLMPLTSLSYLGIDTNDFKEGDTFNSINGKEVCKKYRIKFPQQQEAKNKVRGVTKRFERIDNKLMPEHLDSDNWWKNQHKIGEYEWCIVTQKIHGCVHQDTIIETEDGNKTIKEIVDNKLNVKIKCFDIDNQQVIYCDIDGYYFKQDTCDWYEIETEDGQKLIITGNNPVWLPENNCYRNAEDLADGDVVLVD